MAVYIDMSSTPDGSFEVWGLTIAPGEERAVAPDDWADALVIVRSGDLDAGDMLALCWLRARNLANVGVYPLVLGSGKRLFREGTPPKGFALAEAVAGSNGALTVIYRPTVRADVG